MRKKLVIYLGLFIVISILIGGCKSRPDNINVDSKTQEIKGGSHTQEQGEIVEIIDMANRKLELQKNPDKLISTDSVGAIIIYSINPDKLMAWNYDLKEGEKQYIDKKYHDLPNIGGAGKGPLNLEEILKIDPDLLVSVGEIDDVSIKKMDELQDKIKIPILMLESDMNMLDKSYEILGGLMEEDRANKLAKYCRDTMEGIKGKSKKIEEGKRLGLYYAEGPGGLETEPSNSWHGQVIDLIGARNVAKVEAKKDRGKTEVNLEQIIKWNPDIIISWADERGGYFSGILEDEAWKDIKAVKDKRVYEIPNRPFNWFDRPPSVNRILGVSWLGNLIYPEIYDYEIKDLVGEFYRIFYHYELTDQEIDELLKNSL